ncbi:hypothetical protein J1N35_011637 [Gossypium stocksii]|uniref:Uncharacterized protein n=1 Tax=Gossypium stocksii TaxID=47602 RepID=A0A9D3W2T4_9ROSI|nr:hypothetical protein J1N35_011637 [Gossypium stocksii]
MVLQKITKFWMGREDASGKETANGMAGYEHITTTPKFKRCKVLAIWDFPPGCGRGAVSNLGLHRQIAVDQSSRGKYS